MAPLVAFRCSLITHDNYCSLLYVAENKLVVFLCDSEHKQHSWIHQYATWRWHWKCRRFQCICKQVHTIAPDSVLCIVYNAIYDVKQFVLLYCFTANKW